MVSCKKDETINPQKPNNLDVQNTNTKTIKNSDNQLHFYRNGNFKDELDFNNYIITETTSIVQIESSVLFVFENDGNLLSWTNENGEYNEIKENVATKSAEMTRLRNMAIETGLINDYEGSLKFAENYKPGTDASGCIFTKTNYNGSVWLLPALAPWFIPKMNNNTMSLIGAATVLCDYTWFGGAKVFWIAGGCSNFGALNFNNKASSAF